MALRLNLTPDEGRIDPEIDPGHAKGAASVIVDPEVDLVLGKDTSIPRVIAGAIRLLI